jgi:hypothetical protein
MTFLARWTCFIRLSYYKLFEDFFCLSFPHPHTLSNRIRIFFFFFFSFFLTQERATYLFKNVRKKKKKKIIDEENHNVLNICYYSHY